MKIQEFTRFCFAASVSTIHVMAEAGVVTMQQTKAPMRRHASRFEAPEGVWVYWGCGGRDDASRIRNLSPGGLFIEALEPGAANAAVNAKVKLDFLVQEGNIRAEAIVRHVASGKGLGLKFTAVKDEDRAHFAALLKRVIQLNLHAQPQTSRGF